MEKQEIIKKIKKGKIFIYPTDTIYGIGCDATNQQSVNKIKQIKKRKNKPMSVIAPNISWIKDHLIIDIDLDKYLPGPFTIILKKKNKNFLKHVSDTDMLGIRIPKCNITKTIQMSGVPFITTSVNLAGEKPITKISEIPDQIKDQIDVIIDQGPLTGKPSTIIIGEKQIKR